MHNDFKFIQLQVVNPTYAIFLDNGEPGEVETGYTLAKTLVKVSTAAQISVITAEDKVWFKEEAVAGFQRQYKGINRALGFRGTFEDKEGRKML